MACKFACSLSYSKAFNENKVVSFWSSAGDEYRMKYKSNVCRDLLMKIEWSLAKEVLVTVKLYNKTYKRCFNSKGMVLIGNKCFMKLRGAFNICKSPDYNILCVISVLPYINFREQVKKPLLSIATPVEKEFQPISVNNDNITSDTIGILSNTTGKANEIDKQDYCKEIEPVAEVQLKDFSTDRDFTSNDDLKASGTEFESFKNRKTNDYLSIKDAVEFESSEQWKDTDISSCSIDEQEDHDTLLLSTVKINEQGIQNGMQEIFKDSTNHMQNETDKDITPDVQIINMLPSNISVQMNPLIGFKLDEDKQILLLKDFRDANRESTVTVQEIFSNTAESNEIIDTNLSQISAQEQDNFISHSIENISMIKPMANIPDDLTLKEISTEENEAMEIEYEELSTHKPVSQSTDDIVNTGLKTADIEINTASILDANYEKNDALKEIPSPKLSVDKYSLILDEMLMNDIQLHVKLSIDPECELKSLPAEKESKNLQMGICNSIQPIETENERIPVHQPKIVSDDAGNVVIKKPDTEIKASMPLCETNDNKSNVSEIISPKSSTDTYSPSLHEAIINDTKLKVKSSFEQKSPLKKMNFITESGSNDLSVNIPIKSKEIQDKVISDSLTEVCESMSSLSSIKSDLVLQTLNQGICIDESGFISNTDETIFSSSETNVEKTAELNATYVHTFPVMENELRGLSLDMLDLLMSGDMADGIITNGKKEIKVHRAIVSARSSVLKELFSNPIRQNMEYRATVDVPTYILEDFIVFIYVGLVRIKNLKMAKDMYRVAMKYCIKDLLHICSKYISE